MFTYIPGPVTTTYGPNNSITIEREYMQVDSWSSSQEPDPDTDDADEEDNYEVPNDPVIIEGGDL